MMVSLESTNLVTREETKVFFFLATPSPSLIDFKYYKFVNAGKLKSRC